MGLEVLVEVVAGGELSLTLSAGHGGEVLAEVPGKAGRGEELFVTLAAGEPLGVDVGLLVSLQGPGLVKQSPTLGLAALQHSLLTLPLLPTFLPHHEVTVQHLEEAHHVTLSQLDISGVGVKF